MVLEDLIRSKGLCAQVRAGPLGMVIDGFLKSIDNIGYTANSLRDLALGLAHLGRFLVAHGVAELGDLRWQHLDDYVATLPVYLCLGKYPMRATRGTRAVWHLTRHLRKEGMAPPERPSATVPVYAPLLEEWLTFLRQHRGLAEKSLELYRGHITPFWERLGPQATPAGLRKVEPECLRGYVQQRAAVLSRSERKLAITTLRGFLRFALSRGYLDRDLTIAVERVPSFKHEHLPRGPRWSEVLKLPGTVDRTTAQGRRDYAVLMVFITYGVRNGQMSRLQLESRNWRAGTIRFEAAQAGRQLDLPLTNPVGNALVDYLRYGRPRTSTRFLFVSTDPPFEPLQAQSFYNLVAQAFQKAGIESPHRGSHAIRHAWATHMLAEGHSLKTIADLLGHRSIETTRIYAKVDLGRLREVALPWPGEANP